MYLLEKIVFLHSAGFEYAEFDLRGKTHFSGGNGTGKSRVMHAIACMMAGKAGVLPGVLPRLFPVEHALIIAQWQNKSRKFCSCAYAAEGNIQFLFVSGEYEKEIFTDSAGPLSLSEIVDQIHYRKLDHFQPDADDYPAILWGFRQGLSEPVVKKFQLTGENGEPMVHALFPGYYKRPDFESVFFQKLHRISLSQPLPGLTQIGEMLHKFSTGVTELQAYHREKVRIPFIVAQADKIADYELRIHALFATLSYRQKSVFFQKQQLAEAKEKLQKKLKNRQILVEDTLKLLRNQTEELHIQKVKTLALLEIAREKYAFYQNHPQAHLLDELPLLPVRKKELENARKKQDKPDGKLPAADGEKQKSAQEKADFILELDSREALLRQDYFHSVAEFTAQKTTEKENLITSFRSEADRLEQELQKNTDKLFELYFRITNTDHKRKKSDNSGFDELSAEIERLEEKQIKLAAEAEVIKNAQEVLRLKKSYETEAEEKQQKEILSLAEIKLETLQAKLVLVNSQIKNRQGTFYQWLEKNYPDWKKTFGKIVREDVLFHPFLSPEIERLNDLVFGVKMDLTDLHAEVKSVRDLEKEKSAFEKQIETQENEIQTLQAEAEKRYAAIEKKYQQKFRQAEKDQKKNQYERDLNQSRLQQLHQKLKSFSHESEKVNAAKTIQLQYEAADMQKAIQQLRLEKQALYEKLDKSISEAEKAINQHAKAAKKNLETSIKKLEKLREEIPHSFPPKSKLSAEVLEMHIEALEIAEKVFRRYADDKRDYFDRIPFLEDLLKTQEQKITEIIRQQEQEKATGENELLHLQNEIEQTDAEIRDIEIQLTAFENFRQSPVFEIHHSDANVAEVNETDETLPVIIRRIREVDYALQREVETLKREIHLFTSCFSRENLAGFAVSFETLADYLRFARQIRDFHESDRIENLRDQLGTRFASLVHQLSDISNCMEKRFRSAETLVVKINKLLSGIPEPLHISLAVLRGDHPLTETFLKIGTFAKQNPHQLGERSLFNQNENQEANRDALHLLETINTLVRDYPGMEIADCDIISLRIETRIGRKTFSSPGERYFLQQVLRIALLRSAMEQTSPKEMRLPLLADQAELLDDEYLNMLTDFASQGNIDLITAAPEVPGAIDYDQVYLLGSDQPPLTMFLSLNKSKAFSSMLRS